jgi:phosphate transport system substrate-binding protein
MVPVAPKAGTPAVAPTIVAVHDKTYPLARSLHLYTLGEPQGAVKAYIDWILSAAGQKVVEEAGYVPVAAVEAEASPSAPAAPEATQSKP